LADARNEFSQKGGKEKRSTSKKEKFRAEKEGKEKWATTNEKRKVETVDTFHASLRLPLSEESFLSFRPSMFFLIGCEKEGARTRPMHAY